jgi:hypothetical protein
VTEIGFYALIVAGALTLPRVHPKWFRALQGRYVQLARRRALSIGIVAALVLVLRGALIPLLPTPVPAVHDEYSYLLAGDTFASGRLTNPPHPLWKSLETFYVIQHPTYSSMYPPAQGLALAAGYLLGHPWIGVYLSVAAMCGAICWMLQGWVPPQWALTGGLIAVLRWGVYSYWIESYWGGAVAALGGALAVGALPRLLRKRSIWPAVTAGIGLLIMANSRPFEGLLFGVVVFGILAVKLWQAGPIDLSFLFRRVALPLAAVFFVGVVSMGYYFWRVTGNPLRMPYQLHSAVYELTDPFIWQPLRKAPKYRYVVMERYHVGRQTAAYNEAHSLRGWLGETWRKAESLAIFYSWPAILPTLVALPFLRRNAKVRIALFAAALMFTGLTLEIWPMTLHYHAPLAGMMILLLVQVMRFWRRVEWRGRPVGAAISPAIPVLCGLLLAIRVSAAVLHVPLPEHGLAPWFTVVPGNVDRAKIEAYLEHQYGPQLVIVRYDDTHHVDEEWVHNSADIDGSKVVWARDADPRQNAQLLAYFRQRHAWLLEADVKPPRLTSLSSPGALLTTATKPGAAVPVRSISLPK